MIAGSENAPEATRKQNMHFSVRTESKNYPHFNQRISNDSYLWWML